MDRLFLDQSRSECADTRSSHSVGEQARAGAPLGFSGNAMNAQLGDRGSRSEGRGDEFVMRIAFLFAPRFVCSASERSARRFQNST